LKSNKSIKFCSQSCGTKYLNKKEQEKIDKLNKEINDLNRQQVENLIKLMKTGKKLTFDFENVN